ncbi:MAG TPA: DUF2625 family protein [Actinoplanes sp.]|nr:DUF2625 family protein [Actinoplanes sp.]
MRVWGVEQTAWAEISAVMEVAPYPVVVLPVDGERGASCLAVLGITERSWLGAVIANSGGLVVDHGWLRVLGGGHDLLPDVVGAMPEEGGLVVAFDVMGGRFVWAPSRPGAVPTVHYFGPEDLTWQDLELGYGDWLNAMLAGALAGFYAGLRWPGWVDEVTRVALDQGISTYPPPWTVEGKDLAAVSRKPVPLTELVSIQHEAATTECASRDSDG